MTTLKPLSETLQKIANVELGEVPERIPEDLSALKLWIQQQPHLKARDDDQFLIQFLRGCKYSLEKAKEKIDHFYAIKTKYPNVFSVTNVDDVKFREIQNLGILIPLPTPLNECGPRISVFRYNYPVNKYCVEDAYWVTNAVQEVLMVSDPYACIYGVVYLLDLAQATPSHFLQMSPGFLKKIVTYYEKTLPIRIKAVYVINASGAAEQFLKLLLSLCSEKLKQRFFICGKNLNNLSELFPKKYLPQEYGGENGSLDQLCVEYNNVWDEHREYFKQNADYGTDERLRLGKPIDFEGLFGLGGSFRKLNVD